MALETIILLNNLHQKLSEISRQCHFGPDICMERRKMMTINILKMNIIRDFSPDKGRGRNDRLHHSSHIKKEAACHFDRARYER